MGHKTRSGLGLSGELGMAEEECSAVYKRKKRQRSSTRERASDRKQHDARQKSDWPHWRGGRALHLAAWSPWKGSKFRNVLDCSESDIASDTKRGQLLHRLDKSVVSQHPRSLQESQVGLILRCFGTCANRTDQLVICLELWRRKDEIILAEFRESLRGVIDAITPSLAIDESTPPGLNPAIAEDECTPP